MFGTIFFILLICSLIPLGKSIIKLSQDKQSDISIISVAMPIMLAIGYWVFNQYSYYSTENWWFELSDRTDVFWTLLIPKFKIFLASFIVLMTLISLFIVRQYRKYIKKEWSLGIGLTISFIISVFFSAWISTIWKNILMFMNRSLMNIEDAVFGKDISYYMFDLPLFDDLLFIGKSLIGVLAIVTLIMYFIKTEGKGLKTSLTLFPKSVGIFAALWCILHVFDSQLSIYQLMYSDHGVIRGVGYTDEMVRIPMLITTQYVYGILSVIILLATFINAKSKLFNILSFVSLIVLFGSLIGPCIYGGFQLIWIIGVLGGCIMLGIYWFIWGRKMEDELSTPINIGLTMVVTQVIINSVLIPELVQTFVVDPNEAVKEAPYIARNIAGTRSAFGIDSMYLREETINYSDTLTREMIVEHQNVFENTRILDYGATVQILDQDYSYSQYYDFRDVDVDRYNGKIKFLGIREMNQKGLSSNSYINQVYKYGHGYSHVFMSGSEYDLDTGFPIVETSRFPAPGQPRVYYQEGSFHDKGFFYANSEINEHDYPSKDSITHYKYEGTGGVQLNSFFKRLMFANQYDWKLILGNAQVHDSTRIMLNRQVHKRVSKLCPFLEWDNDAHPIKRNDGSLVWMLHGYSLSDKYPYSAEYSESTWNDDNAELNKQYNFIRHSAKAIVDAYNGTVSFYSFNEEDDPIVTTIKNIFPTMFQSLDDMPTDLKEHLIYPSRLFRSQASMLGLYHMDHPEEFYTQEKIWRIATEQYMGQKTKMSPRYMMDSSPTDETLDFNITVPFTPKELNADQTRDFLTGYLVGSCDYENFLQLTLKKYSRDKQVYAPWKIEVRIDAEDRISKEMTFYDDKGSKVIRGNMITTPIENTVVFTEPFYVASDNNGKTQLPAIKMIIAAHNNKIAWGRNTSEALYNLTMNISPKEIDKYEGPVKSVYDQYQVVVPSIDQEGNLVSEIVTSSSQEEAMEKMNQAIEQLKYAVQQIESAHQSLQNPEVSGTNK